jgi:phosphatidylinositol glycan class V
MPTRGQYLQSERVHKWQLVALFVAWKCLLFVIASYSPGPGYDTSSLILSNPSRHRHTELAGWSWADRIAINHFRWDSLYFVKTAQRGYVHEQEWAFSWVYSAVVRTAVKCERAYLYKSRTDVLEALSPNPEPPLLQYVWAGIAVSNISHFVSMLILFKLVNVLLGESRGARTSFIACALYVISPAGIFLSAPYGEALFAALNLGGMLCYVQARAVAHSNKSWTFRQDAEVVSSALLFGLATWIRGNGLLSGLIFLFDVASAAPRIVRMQSGSSDLRRVTVTLVAGVLLGIMAIIPQYIAYNDYCNGVDDSGTRPWCYKTIPSIYTWVQSEYWLVA